MNKTKAGVKMIPFRSSRVVDKSRSPSVKMSHLIKSMLRWGGKHSRRKTAADSSEDRKKDIGKIRHNQAIWGKVTFLSRDVLDWRRQRQLPSKRRESSLEGNEREKRLKGGEARWPFSHSPSTWIRLQNDTTFSWQRVFLDNPILK